MAGIEEAALDGFRGGFAARRAPTEFGDEQWSKLEGFVIEDGAVLRSQWPLQVVGNLTDVVSFGIYRGVTETPFLVAVRASGAVVWRVAPPDDVEFGSAELDEAWLPVKTEGGDNLVADPGARPLTTIPMDASKLAHAAGGLRSALMLNTIHMPDAGSAAANVWFIYEADDPATESVRLRAMTLGTDKKWPVDDETDASPKGQHAILWSGVLILGDIEWKDDPDEALSSTNKTRFANGLWMSVPGEPLLFDPLSVLFIDDPSTHITGLSSTLHGLLVYTSSVEGLGGVHLLRGTPDAFTLEPLQVGMGVTEGVTRWIDTSTDCWVNASGELWQTDTDSFRRLDRQGLGTDRQNPDEDGVQSYGPWLLAVRERRMFALRALDDGQTAAWTELVITGLPGLPDLRYAEESGQSLYFLAAGGSAGGSIARFTRADMRTGVSERGRTPGGLVDLSVGSRTLSTGEGHNKTFWHRVGVRATAGRRSTGATVEKLILRAGPVRDHLTPSLERVGPWALTTAGGDEPGTFAPHAVSWGGEDVSWDGVDARWTDSILPVASHSPKRWQSIVRGIGASNEFSIEALFRGDVQVEQFSIFFRGSILGGTEEGH